MQSNSYSLWVALAMLSACASVFAQSSTSSVLSAAGAAVRNPESVAAKPQVDAANAVQKASPPMGNPVATQALPSSAVTPKKSTPTVRSVRDTGREGVLQAEALTREQFQIDRAQKQDTLAGIQLSTAQKRKQLKTLADDTPRGAGVTAAMPLGALKVIGVEGHAAHLIATVRFASGEEIEARKGDVLPDGRVIANVTPTGVSLKDGGRVLNVPILVASKGQSAASSQLPPVERVMVPMGGTIPAPSAVQR